jgi:acetyltransferase-like isoleucine patch superfamily enzyme
MTKRRDDTYFPEDESATLARIRSEIIRYRSTALMNDRERAQFLGLPDGCRIRENAKILNQENFVCGTNVWIGEGAILDAQGGLEIGDNTQIGLGVFVWSHSTHMQAIAGETAQDKRLIEYKSTRIGSNCFIAGPSVIAPGVTIGDRAIISPLSFVEEDVPPRGIISNRAARRAAEERLASLESEIEQLRERLSQIEGG